MRTFCGAKFALRLAALLLAVLLLASALPASAAGRRVALVVGVSDYLAVAPLRNTLNDSIRITASLERLGFEVTRVANPGRAEFAGALREFGARARDADTSLFFYAGHALEVNGRNWLLPADARLESALDLPLAAVDVESVLDRAKLASTAILLLDACRNNPFAERLAAGNRGFSSRGLARIDPPSRVLVAFATAPGQVAQDGDGANSPFTQALLNYMETPGLEIRQLMSRVRADVRKATHDQVPWEQSALEGDFYFAEAVNPPPVPTTAAAVPAIDSEALFWDSVRGSGRAADYEAYLAHFPAGLYSMLARSRVAALQLATAIAPPPVTASDVPAPSPPAPNPPSPNPPSPNPPSPNPPSPSLPSPSPPAPSLPAPSPAAQVQAAPVSPPVIVEPPPAPAPAVVAVNVAPPVPVVAATPALPVAAPLVVALAPLPPPQPDRAAIARQLEERLRTLGCFRAEIDSDWNGAAATSAMARLMRANAGKPLPNEASELLLTQLASADIKACMPDCRRGYVQQGGTCVQTTCDAGEVRTRRELCIEAPQVQAPARVRRPRHAARPAPEPDPAPAPIRVRRPRQVAVDPPAPVRHARPHVVRERVPAAGGGGGRCFMVDGRQFCS